MKLRREHVVQMLRQLDYDRTYHLEKIDRYMRGEHDPPYMPQHADAEYRLLADRSINNWLPLVRNTAAQTLRWDGYRRGGEAEDTDALHETAEWRHMQKSRYDSRQGAVIRDALTFGHSFSVTERRKDGKELTYGLSPLLTTALFEDPANDIAPEVMLTVLSWPDGDTPGRARVWDELERFEVTFKSLVDDKGLTIREGRRHGLPECPGTRHAPFVDLAGRTVGLIEPLIPLQDRINQTTFDLLIAQSYTSFEVRTATGMAAPFQTEPVYEIEGDPTSPVIGSRVKLDPATGEPMAKTIDINPMRLLMSDNPDARFGSLPGGELGGFIEALDMHVRHFAAQSQTPPHYLLGQMANLSAEALNAAEKSLHRLVNDIKTPLGESFQRDFRLAAYLTGDEATYNNHAGSVIWIDAESHSLSQALDALVKAKELEIPARGLWARIPNVTQGELTQWAQLREEEDSEYQLTDALRSARSDEFAGSRESFSSVSSGPE